MISVTKWAREALIQKFCKIYEKWTVYLQKVQPYKASSHLISII